MVLLSCAAYGTFDRAPDEVYWSTLRPLTSVFPSCRIKSAANMNDLQSPPFIKDWIQVPDGKLKQIGMHDYPPFISAARGMDIVT